MNLIGIIIICFAGLVFAGMAISPLLNDYMSRELRKEADNG